MTKVRGQDFDAALDGARSKFKEIVEMHRTMAVDAEKGRRAVKRLGNVREDLHSAKRLLAGALTKLKDTAGPLEECYGYSCDPAVEAAVERAIAEVHRRLHFIGPKNRLQRKGGRPRHYPEYVDDYIKRLVELGMAKPHATHRARRDFLEFSSLGRATPK